MYGIRYVRQAHDSPAAGGLADDRWKLLAGAPFALYLPFRREDGSEGRFTLCLRYNFAKVKFRNGEAQPAKFYLIGNAGELNEER